MINLYFDAKDQVHYFNDLNKECDACGKIITDTIIIRAFWDKLGSGINYLCSECKGQLKKSDSATYSDTIKALVDADIPSKAMPRVFSKPSLQCSSNMMTCDVAAMNMNNEKVIDKTVYSGRSDPKVKEYLIEAENDNIDLHLEHKAMNNKDLDSFFSSVKKAVPMIGSDDKKVLE